MQQEIDSLAFVGLFGDLRKKILPTVSILPNNMIALYTQKQLSVLIPDFPFKVFSDKRSSYIMLLAALAEDALG
jgi:hypothetical protein